MGIQISLRDPAFSSFTYIPRSGITGSYGDVVFNILRPHHNVFHSSCYLVTFPPPVHRVPISPHPHQHFFLFLNTCFAERKRQLWCLSRIFQGQFFLMFWREYAGFLGGPSNPLPVIYWWSIWFSDGWNSKKDEVVIALANSHCILSQRKQALWNSEWRILQSVFLKNESWYIKDNN